MDAIVKAAGERKERIQGSPNFKAGVVQNVLPTPQVEDPGKMLKTSLEYLDRSVERVPKTPPPTTTPDVEAIDRRDDGLRITWLGHSTMLVAIDGGLFLTDPVFSKRASPFQFLGPARFHEMPLTVSQLPPLDGVVLSHDHYDHLDHAAVVEIAKSGVMFYVPLGVGGHLQRFGISVEQITELDWYDSVEVPTKKGGSVELHAAPARHFSGRGQPGTGNRTLWASWAFIGSQHKVWFSGDTGPFDNLQFEGVGPDPSSREALSLEGIRDRFGTFDIAMIETGAWHPSWGNIHLGPKQAVRMHHVLGAKAYMPVHWGTFNLALHAWDEPILHVQELMSSSSSALLSPIAGQTLQHDVPFIHDVWRDRWTRWRETEGAAALLASSTTA